jgi:hypothetical protein
MKVGGCQAFFSKIFFLTWCEFSERKTIKKYFQKVIDGGD